MELDDDLGTEDLQLAGRLAVLRRTPTAAARSRMLASVRAGSATAAMPRRPRRGLRLAVLLAAPLAALGGGGVAAMAASSEALPNGPTYTLRIAGEDVRLAVADNRGKVQLRSQFAGDRLRQVHQVLPQDRGAAGVLLRDAEGYLREAANDVHGLPGAEQGEFNQEIQQLKDEAQRDEGEVNQGGNDQSSHAGSGGPGSLPALAGTEGPTGLFPGNGGQPDPSESGSATGSPGGVGLNR